MWSKYHGSFVNGYTHLFVNVEGRNVKKIQNDWLNETREVHLLVIITIYLIQHVNFRLLLNYS